MAYSRHSVFTAHVVQISLALRFTFELLFLTLELRRWKEDSRVWSPACRLQLPGLFNPLSTQTWFPLSKTDDTTRHLCQTRAKPMTFSRG